ncbi:MAG TPA: hypothetical protein PK812_08545 [Beijerinckiaceae bacterium]|nr:hypothetical protein [Beijerinckiaceae bacterium]
MGTVRKAVWVAAFMGLSGAEPAWAQMPQSCMNDFKPLMDARQTAVQRINGLNPKKTTATQACSAFRDLAARNKKVVEYMTANKDWCQIGDADLAAVTQAQDQIEKNRANTCNAAAKQAAQVRQMQRQQQSAQPGVGSGVRLPQGAL